MRASLSDCGVGSGSWLGSSGLRVVSFGRPCSSWEGAGCCVCGQALEMGGPKDRGVLPGLAGEGPSSSQRFPGALHSSEGKMVTFLCSVTHSRRLALPTAQV